MITFIVYVDSFKEMNIEKKGHVSLNLWTHFNDILNALDDKNKQESLLWWNVFRYIKVYVF